LIKRAQCSLALGRDGPADADISKAGKIISDTNVDRGNPILSLRYKVHTHTHSRARDARSHASDSDSDSRLQVCIAKTRDRQGNFLAAVRYYNGLAQSELMGNKEEPLRAACICAIVAQAGPLRSKWLNTLYKDERCQKFERIKHTIFPVLEQMYVAYSSVLESTLVRSFVRSFVCSFVRSFVLDLLLLGRRPTKQGDGEDCAQGRPARLYQRAR